MIPRLQFLSTSLCLLLVACAEPTGDPPFSKADAEAAGGKSDSGDDLCELFGWYGDKVCDEFCSAPDPDCTTCPDPSDPAVHYIADSYQDPAVCLVITFACEEDQTPFSDACGCGCIDTEPAPEFCGGLAQIPCSDPNDQCIDDPSDDCDPTVADFDCGGICVPKASEFCGGFGQLPCSDPTDLCIDDPSDDCDPAAGDFDCGGICVAGGDQEFCGGFAQIMCSSSGDECVDDPSDGCELGVDPDCGGTCVAKQQLACPDPSDPAVHYIADSDQDPGVCLVILFGCEEGQELFSDECGCGCIDP